MGALFTSALLQLRIVDPACFSCTVRLTVIDTPGFGDYVNNRDSWQPIIEFLDDQHESYMLQEQQPRRTDKIDMRVHACLYFIRPTGHTLKPLDIEVMKRLSSRVNLIPVVAKADTLSHADLAKYKERVSRIRGVELHSRAFWTNQRQLDPRRYRGPGH